MSQEKQTDMTTAGSNFEDDLSNAIVESKLLRDARIDRITTDLQATHLSTSWDDLRSPLQQAFRDAGLEAYAQIRSGEALTWSH